VHAYLRDRAAPGTVFRRLVQHCPRCGYTVAEDIRQGNLARGHIQISCPMCHETTIALI
jgi:hypothetical protein